MDDEIDTYRDIYAEWVKIDDLNLEDKVKQVPSQKQFWLSRLIDAKRDLIKLNKRKKSLREAVISKMVNGPVRADKVAMKEVDNSPQLEDINDKIEQVELLVEFLENLLKLVSFISQDFKNIIDVKKLSEL